MQGFVSWFVILRIQHTCFSRYESSVFLPLNLSDIASKMDIFDVCVHKNSRFRTRKTKNAPSWFLIYLLRRHRGNDCSQCKQYKKNRCKGSSHGLLFKSKTFFAFFQNETLNLSDIASKMDIFDVCVHKNSRYFWHGLKLMPSGETQ